MNYHNIEISIMKVVDRGKNLFYQKNSKFAPKQQSLENRNTRIFPREGKEKVRFVRVFHGSNSNHWIEVGAAREVFTLARSFCRKWDLNWAGSPFVKIVFRRKVESVSLVKRAVVVGIHNGFNRWKNWPVKWVLFLLAFSRRIRCRFCCLIFFDP